jgi:IS5 family transposase
VNRVLAKHAVEQEELDVSDLRTDTTVVEANIHYPTDSSLLWDSWRVLVRMLRAAKEVLPEIAGHRFHDAKVKKIHLWLTRHAGKTGTRKRQIRRQGRRLVDQVQRVYEIAERAATLLAQKLDFLVQALGQELAELLPVVAVVLETTERSLVKGETVPAKERVFSIFEPHVELIKRGKKGKPVEFGHAVVLCQTRDKFITDYEVMEEKIPDQELTDVLLERHQEQFGAYPNGITADTGFNPKSDKREVLESKVTTLAIPQKVFDWGQKVPREWQCFRAGIEGSISVLKRAFGLFRCLNRGFRNFAASVGLAIVSYNLLKLVSIVNS